MKENLVTLTDCVLHEIQGVWIILAVSKYGNDTILKF